MTLQTSSFFAYFVPTHLKAMLTKHFERTHKCISPFSSIERGKGGLDTKFETFACISFQSLFRTSSDARGTCGSRLPISCLRACVVFFAFFSRNFLAKERPRRDYSQSSCRPLVPLYPTPRVASIKLPGNNEKLSDFSKNIK